MAVARSAATPRNFTANSNGSAAAAVARAVVAIMVSMLLYRIVVLGGIVAGTPDGSTVAVSLWGAGRVYLMFGRAIVSTSCQNRARSKAVAGEPPAPRLNETVMKKFGAPPRINSHQGQH